MTRHFRAARFDIHSGRVRTTNRAQDPAETQLPLPLPSETRLGPPITPIPPGPIEITTPPVQTGGFIGPGSYRTGLTANEGQTPLDMSGYSGTTASPGTTTTHTIDRKKLDLGLQIIDFVLEYYILLQNLMRHIYSVVRMPIAPHKLMLPAAEALFSTIRAEVAVNDDDAKLRTVIRIFQTMASLYLIHIYDRDFTLLDPDKRKKQDLVRPFHGITDTLTTLTTLYRFGDSSQHLYPIFIELTSTIYATGMHQDNVTGGSSPAEYPGFMHQWRRRCFTAVYAMDKTIATTLGRPPLVHRNYCVLDAPLDFDDDDLTGPELEFELGKLDENGWNTDGRPRTTTFMRLRYLLATVREEVLELHLGVNSIASTPDRAQLVLEKLQSVWNSCADIMKYSSAVWNSSMSSHDIWFLIRFYLDYLYSSFLIFRYNSRHNQSPESMQLHLRAAKDVLSTLVFNEQREVMREVRSDFSAVFLPYGLPCADTLAAELVYRPSSFSLGPGCGGLGGPSSTGSRPPLTRAEVVRDLTVYVSCLSWMPGRSGNSSGFSREVQAQLTQVLDQIIDSSLSPPPPPGGVTGGDDALAEKRDHHPGGIRGREAMDTGTTAVVNTNHLFFDWDMSIYLDSQLDLFSQSLL
ncbi:hypothetical protein C8A00DRAFT_37830 [Chaetomidium leptoderma]|uniref:Xylanolytic transcriptional activator regulatory domain-containing protein n=1 Tax=Chaetomidium leptoderma TaxID=669021 RepID=A0AAN6VDW3_9PEZI|nr:hypothetical protein C8A00DRAFT_37830 [Chaetomidium leptoderma]